MMSTPNMSFDSPIIVTKSNFGDVDRQKDSGESSRKNESQTENKEAKLEEEKRAKKRDMFAPEADMFAEEYSVSFLFDYLFQCAHIQSSLLTSNFSQCRILLACLRNLFYEPTILLEKCLS